MESIGDWCGSHAETSKKNSITLSIYLDEFKVLLMAEEEKLKKLEERRKKLECDMENLERAILEEKDNFRNVISVITHQENSTEAHNDDGELESVDELIAKSKQVIGDVKTASYDMNWTGSIYDVMANLRSKSKAEYMESMEQFLAEKESLRQTPHIAN